VSGLLALLVMVGVGATALAAKQSTILVSRSGGESGDGRSLFPSVSADGSLIAFRSEATDLHPDDDDLRSDILVRDLDEGGMVLASRASGAGGEKGNGSSFNPRISANGRFVVFRSNADNLDPGDVDRESDLYLRDLKTDETTLVSRASGAAGAKGNAGSFNPSISADGRLIAFRSEATNLDPADTDAVEDIFVRDLETNETTLVSRAKGKGGTKGNGPSSFPVLSGDGSLVAFRSEATNLHPDDGNATRDIFARDLDTDKTILVSRAKGANGRRGNGASTFASVSRSGRYIAFDSLADNLDPDDPDASADVLLRDLKKNRTDLVSRAGGFDGPKSDGGASEPSISSNGRYVAFHSTAANLDRAGQDGFELDVFVRDTRIGRTILISRGSGGKANAPAEEPWISGDGSLVAFQSEATNLSKGDTDPTFDVFARPLPPVPRCSGRKATAMAADGALTRGTRGSDVIVGNPGADVIRAGKGRDRVCGGGGGDRIEGGPGGDRLKGEGGRDLLEGRGGRDRLNGGAGRDRLRGGTGRDRCKGGPGRDRTSSC
jgi:Tol biopolymer transport system component